MFLLLLEKLALPDISYCLSHGRYLINDPPSPPPPVIALCSGLLLSFRTSWSPCCFSSASVSCLQLLRGRPLFLFPRGFQVRAWPVVLDAGFLTVDSRLHRDFSGSSHTSDIKRDIPVATLSGAWRYWVSAATGWPGVSILLLGEIESLICNFWVWQLVQLSEQIRSWDTLSCCWDTLPCCWDTLPCCWDTLPCCWDTLPCCWDTLPCCWDTLPCCWDTQPCCWDTLPCCWDTQPCCWDTLPCCWDTQPCCWDTLPCCWDTQPIPKEDTLRRWCFY